MAELITMPKQGLQMTEGTIMSWLIEEGGQVTEGQPLFEMETDKLTISIDAACSGVLLKILCNEGDVVPISAPIAIIGTPGEDISSLLNEAASQAVHPATASPAVEETPSTTPDAPQAGSSIAPNNSQEPESSFASPRALKLAQEKGLDFRKISGTGPEGLVIERDVLAYAASSQIAASPLAKKIASLNGVPPETLQGSGARGKVMAEDVLSAIAAKVETRINSCPRGEQCIPFTGMRRIVAKRMKESLNEMAQAYHRITVDMTEAIKLRTLYKNSGVKVSYNDIVLRCVAAALTDFPMMNASWSDSGIILKNYVNLGMAVAVEEGLLVPVIKNADLMKLTEIAACSVELATKAKNHSLGTDEYSGGTFTVSNLGMFDIDDFTAIINPPEAGILAVGKMSKRAVVKETAKGDEVIVRSMMNLCLSYDHRIVDGAPAAGFLKQVKTYLENPALLV